MQVKPEEKTNINLKSNLMVKSRITNHNWIRFAPADLLIKLHPEYRDSRVAYHLSPEQREQQKRALFLAKEIVDVK